MSQVAPGLEERFFAIKEKVDGKAKKEGRQVALLAVSKTFPKEAIWECAKFGQRLFGENYAQEGVEKVKWFKEKHPELHLEWHFIGPLQGNKTRIVAEHFDWVESVSRLRIAKRLSEQRPFQMGPINILIEVNADNEESKSGINRSEVLEFARQLQCLPNIKLRGIMSIPRADASKEETLSTFKMLKELFDELKKECQTVDTLSIGMSSDFDLAIEAGSTEVRIGSAIFGARQYLK